ncbi:MAG: hypothetical protein L0G27_10950 [Paracoccus sp. (in: a-proteobacteria)]|nr:hypothetical protein [Paracoccus sp. (in: a-proteobacteria)]
MSDYPAIALILPVCFAGGLLLGLAYFQSLRMTADLITGQSGPMLALALTLGRLALLVAGFYAAVLFGGLALLAALGGVLAAKMALLRLTRGVAR